MGDEVMVGKKGITGVYIRTEKHKKILSDSHKKRYENLEERLKTSHAMKKYCSTHPEQMNIHSQKMKIKWSDSLYKQSVVNTIRKNWGDPSKKQRMLKLLIAGRTPESNKSRYDSIKKFYCSPEGRKQLSQQTKKCWQNIEYRNKVVSATLKSVNQRPNVPELIVISYLIELKMVNWHYTGNGAFVINGKCPDFVNFEHKKIIEVYGDYWHKNHNPQDRIDFFKANGFDCIILWEHDIKEHPDATKNRILDFSKMLFEVLK